ncbi:hypothetical protein L2K20_08255 [Mycobacterium sp. MBM]|nr:hypothetical protein [Mycobacterium sp. MBM]
MTEGRGSALSDEEIDQRWEAWHPAEVAEHLAHVRAPWCVAAGWALDLFVGEVTRDHDDTEIAVPSARFGEIVAALPGYAWDVVGDGRIWPYPQRLQTHFQTWLREPSTGIYRLDVFREPHRDDHWLCRRDPAIALPVAELILRTDDGIPYVIPEVALLFKAKHLRAKDEADFRRVLPELAAVRRFRLCAWLSRLHPGHPWIGAL